MSGFLSLNNVALFCINNFLKKSSIDKKSIYFMFNSYFKSIGTNISGVGKHDAPGGE